jgi:hypothetical protein
VKENNMGLARTIRRQKQKAAKRQAKKEMTAVVHALASMPDTCSVCAAPFDKKDPVAMQDWQVEVSETEDTKIMCLDCQVMEVENEI